MVSILPFFFGSLRIKTPGDYMNKFLTSLTKTSICLFALAFGSPIALMAQGMSIGNGSANWIQTEGMQRDGNVLKFAEVQIDGDGWLVIHPFQDGAPNGDRVVARTFLKSGTNTNVEIEVHKGLSSGEMMIVMLHKDSNNNGEFDFIFVDDRNVMDLAVFEGSTMIGHALPAP